MNPNRTIRQLPLVRVSAVGSDLAVNSDIVTSGG